MRILHAIHDFLPRHRAGSEIYAFELARELSRRAEVSVLAAESDPAVPGPFDGGRTKAWWSLRSSITGSFASSTETYKSERINVPFRHYD